MRRTNNRHLGLLLTAALTLAFLSGCRSDDPQTDTGVKKDGVAPGSEGGTPGETSIFDINLGKVPEGTNVILRDVVVTAVDGYGKYTGDVYVQDPKGGASSGLKLYRPQRLDAGQISDLKPGDHVKVEGKVKFFTPSGGFNDKEHPNKKYIVELDTGCQITRLSDGAEPKPAELTFDQATKDPDAVTWEHVLVTVKNVGVSRPLDPAYGEYEVGGGLGIDDELFPVSAPQVGDCQSLTGVIIYFYGYKLLPRQSADVGTGTGCPVVPTVTIKDIQDEASAKHPASGTTVKTSGVITAIDTTLSTESKPRYIGFHIQDGTGPYSGIYVYYYWDDTTATKPKVGDNVEVIAKYEEYNKLSELSGAIWTVKGAGTVPAPEVLNAQDIATNGGKAEEYEGVLVKVENVEVESITQTTGTNPRKVGIKLKGSGLIVENEYFDFMTPEPAVGTKYTSITGPLHYSFSNFKILPRSAADLAK